MGESGHSCDSTSQRQQPAQHRPYIFATPNDRIGREPGIDYPAGFGVERSLECPRLHKTDRPLVADSTYSDPVPDSRR